VRHFRIDPFEFAQQITFHMDNVKLAADDETKSGSFTIRWTGSDADNDAAGVALYYDTDQNPNNGKTLITSSAALASGQYVWNTSGVPAGTYYIYAVANDGLNADAQYSTGPVKVVNFTPVSKGFLSLNTPQANQVLTSAFEVGGWTLDQAASSGTGVDDIQFLVHPGSLSNPGVFIGHGRLNIPRPDVASIFGAQFTNSGFHYTITGMSPGNFVLEVQAHSTVTNQFSIIATLPFSVSASALMSIDAPSAEATFPNNNFGVSGWAIDRSGASGTGIDQVHVYAYKDPGSGNPPVFLGIAQYGAIQRPDVAALYGARFTNCGYVLNIDRTQMGLGPGTYNVVVWMHSSVSNSFIGNALVQLVLQ